MLDEPLPVDEIVEPVDPEGVVLPCVDVLLDPLMPLPSELPLLLASLCSES